MKHPTLAIILGAAAIGCDPAEDIFPEPTGTTSAETSSMTDGTTGSGPGGDESGTRLRLKYRHGDDGSKVLAGVFDSELGADCAFLAAADGEVRCLPAPIFVGNYYADAACTLPLAYRYGCAAEPPLYLTIGEPVCPPISRVYEVGPKWNGGTAYTSNAAGCTATQLPSGDAYEIGAEVAPSTFVATVVKVD